MAFGGLLLDRNSNRLEPDGSRVRASMAQILCLLWLGGAALAALALVLPQPEGLNEPGYAAIGIVALAVAALLHFAGQSLPLRAIEAICALGLVLISLSNYWGGDQLSSIAENELIYLGLLLFAAYFFRGPALLVQLIVFASSYALLMLSVDAGDRPLTRWAVVTAALTIATLLVARLREQIDYELSLHRATLESTNDGILVVDQKGRWESFNRKFLGMWRIPEPIRVSRDDSAALAFVLDQLDDPAAFVAKVRDLYERPQDESYDVLTFKDGRVFERYSQPQLIDGRVAGRVWSFRDVTERHNAEERLQHLADHDPLTDLLNRRRFEEELGRELTRSTRYGRGGALLLLDLDDFKSVNDTYGHVWGDEVLRATARLLRSRLRSSDVLARLGGDEFAVLLPEADEVHAVKLAEELLEVIRGHAFQAALGDLSLTTSVGVVTLEALDPAAPEPIVAADTAMYRAKRDGRDRLAVFDPERDAAVSASGLGQRRGGQQ